MAKLLIYIDIQIIMHANACMHISPFDHMVAHWHTRHTSARWTAAQPAGPVAGHISWTGTTANHGETSPSK